MNFLLKKVYRFWIILHSSFACLKSFLSLGLCLVLYCFLFLTLDLRAQNQVADLDVGKFSVHTYSQIGEASVNSHWINTGRDIIIIDAQRSSSSASKLADIIEMQDIPVTAIVITHPHPDHYGGLKELKRRFPDAIVYASKQTANAMVDDEFGFNKATKQVLGDDFGLPIPVPDKQFDDDATNVIGSLSFDVFEYGAGEAEYMSILYQPDAKLLFSSDLLVNDMIPFLLEGRSKQWIKQLERLKEQFGDANLALPGHGSPSGVQILVRRKLSYLNLVRQRVREALKNDNILDETERIEIIKELRQLHPGYKRVAAISTLEIMNLDVLAAEIIAEKP